VQRVGGGGGGVGGEAAGELVGEEDVGELAVGSGVGAIVGGGFGGVSKAPAGGTILIQCRSPPHPKAPKDSTETDIHPSAEKQHPLAPLCVQTQPPPPPSPAHLCPYTGHSL